MLTPQLAPYLVVTDSPGLIRFLETGLGATLTFQVKGPDGKVVHSEVRLGDSNVMIGERSERFGAFLAMLHLYVPDALRAHERAVRAGATSVRAPTDGGDGSVRGGVKDAWGNEWWFTTTPARP